MKKIRAGVIGVGYLGKFHAEKYASLPNVQLVGVSDCDEPKAGEIAQKLNVSACGDYRQIIGKVDAVSIVVPTVLHHTIARECLEAGLHVLLEKPITATVEQADDLIDLARRKGALLQIGHIERFNPAVTAIKTRLSAPRYLMAERAAPFTVRCTDVNVIIDLMIHDLDIVTDLAGAAPMEISAAGASVITREIDAATARIVYQNGCVADVTASRVSSEKKRILRVFDGDALYTADYQTQTATLSRKNDGPVCELESQDISSGRRDTLLDEITAFIGSVEKNGSPAVSGEDGRRALVLARMISENIEKGITGFVPVPV